MATKPYIIQDLSNDLGAVTDARQVGPSGGGGGGSGMTDEVKQALLQCFDDVVWKDDESGAADIADLEAALYPAVSIAAVYTQSGTVYDTDSLASLKTDIVVTATLEDGTQSVIPANRYTLSGTLTVGTSTITVTYQELTTTFDVTVSTHLLYSLENYAFDTERIDTEIALMETDHDWSIALDINLTTSPTDGDGSTYRFAVITNNEATDFSLSYGKGNATVSDYAILFMGQYSGTGATVGTGRHRFVITHANGSNEVTVKHRKDSGSAVSKTQSGTFAATTQTLRFGNGTGAMALPKGTINKAEVYDIVLSATQINTFLGL